MAKTTSNSLPAASNQDILTAAKGSGIIFVGRLFEYVGRFAFGIIVARSIGAEGFGTYSLGYTTAFTLAGIALLGMPAALVRFLPIALKEKDEKRVWGTLQVALGFVITIGIIFGAITWLWAGRIAVTLFQDPAIESTLRIVSFWIPLIALEATLMAATRAFKEMQYQVYANSFFFNISRIALTVLFLKMGWGLRGVLIAYSWSIVMEIGLLFYFLHRLFPLNRPLREAQRNFREVTVFSIPVGLSQVVNRLGNNVQLLLVGILGSVASVGVFTAALRVQMIGTMFLTTVVMVAMPMISGLYHHGQREELARLYQTLTRWSLSFVIPFFLMTTLFARPLLAIFGDDFRGGQVALIIITLGTLVNAGTGICGSMLVMAGYSKLSLLNSSVAIGLTVVLDVLLIPRWGIIGAAIGIALAISLINLARLLQVYWILKFWPYDRSFFKPFVAGGVAFAAGLIFNNWFWAETSLLYLFLNVVLLWAIYAAALILLGLSEEDKLVLFQTQKRLGLFWSRTG